MSDNNDFGFDLEGLKDALIAAGLDPKEPHDIRLFTYELREPGTTVADAAKRAAERKQRTAQGSAFDLLNDYFKTMKDSPSTPLASAVSPGNRPLHGRRRTKSNES
ncbi:MAG: hypothetical protein GYA20_10245 [Chloroflexi bacterium]|nr:hypothetical protein [Chloroflexota bacterium]